MRGLRFRAGLLATVRKMTDLRIGNLELRSEFRISNSQFTIPRCGPSIAVAALAIGCVALAAQQPKAEQRPRTTEDGERLEKVGPTMSRVVPQNTPYDRWLTEARSRIPVFSGLVIDDA